MSKRNKNKPKGHISPPSLPASTAPPPKPVVESAVDQRQDREIRRQDREIHWTRISVLAGILLGVASAIAAVWSGCSSAKSAAEAVAANKIAQAVQDRATGKVQARFEFVDDDNRDPDRFREFMRKKDGADQQVFRIENADELVRWSPSVRIKNTGSEPIDAIKTDVHYELGAAYGIGVQQIDPPPIVINETSSHEFTTFGKLDPGRTARIFVAPLLLNQITRLNLKHYVDKDHLGRFTVRVYCRLAGGPSYDRVSDEQPVFFTFHWRTAGFQPDASHVKELLEKKPWVTIEDVK
jgi:hypothetical protein